MSLDAQELLESHTPFLFLPTLVEVSMGLFSQPRLMSGRFAPPRGGVGVADGSRTRVSRSCFCFSFF